MNRAVGNHEEEGGTSGGKTFEKRDPYPKLPVSVFYARPCPGLQIASVEILDG